jgi:hypothetical protein
LSRLLQKDQGFEVEPIVGFGALDQFS